MPEAQHPLYIRLLVEHGYAFWGEVHRILSADRNERDLVALASFSSDGTLVVSVTSLELAVLRDLPSFRKSVRDIEQGPRAEPTMLCLVHVILVDPTEAILRSIAVRPEAPDAST
jgi:hypothetical protein